ncbi:2S seed storage albumin protein-like [Salvia hispanica]|uniref:2S seed storage albumin protein-like n=1 Tax=Salvia hispanica TaxID=49212 RepID=UPI00200906ED|nr:2S seed storage albumin protein-like [Salvia hispanica]
MATKAALAAALLMALVALATATTFTTSFDEEASDNYQQCRQQVQGRRFNSCQRFLQQRSTPYSNEDEDEEVLDSYQPSSSLQACCRELKQMDRQQCGCEAIRQAVKQAQQSTRRYQTGQSEQVYQQARALPRRCGLREQQCRFRLLFV